MLNIANGLMSIDVLNAAEFTFKDPQGNIMLAIIDGDILCYLACRARWKKKVTDGINLIKLDADGKKVALEFTKEEDRAYLEECWMYFRKDLEALLESVFCTDYVMAVKGEGNFRQDMYPSYKLHRHYDPNKQNMFVPILRQLAVAEDYAVAADGFEADDLIRIWAEQARLNKQNYVVCSIDKDLRCIPGKHYLMKTKELIDITPEQAMKNYYLQLLKGDQTDNIKGVPGIGEKIAENLLSQHATEEDYQLEVIAQYMSGYGDNWKNELLFNGKMIHIMRWYDDYFCFKEWPMVAEMNLK